MWTKIEDIEFTPSIKWKSNAPLIGEVILKISSINAKSTWKFAGNLFQIEIAEEIGEARVGRLGLDLGIATKFEFSSPTFFEFEPIIWLPDYRIQVWNKDEILYPENRLISVGSESNVIVSPNRNRQEIILVNTGDQKTWISFSSNCSKQIGYPMPPGKEYHRTKQDHPYYGPISAIAESPTSLLIMEFS